MSAWQQPAFMDHGGDRPGSIGSTAENEKIYVITRLPVVIRKV